MRRTLALVTIGVVAALAIGLRLFHLTAPSLWNDEGGTLSTTTGSGLAAVVSALAHTSQGDHFQPLYFLLLYAWRSIAGSGVFSLRVPSVGLGLAALVVLGLTAARAFGRTHALVTCALLAVSAFLVTQAQEARPYALLSFLAALLLYLFLMIRKQRQQRRYPPLLWAFWACFALAFFASILSAFFAAGLAIGDAAAGGRGRAWMRTWLPCVVASLPALVFAVLSRAALHPRDAEVTQLGGSLLRNSVFAVYGIVAGTTYGPPVEALHSAGATSLVLGYWPSLAALVVVTGVALLAMVLVLRSDAVSPEEHDVARLLLVTFVGSYVLTFGFALLTHLNWQPRHSFFLALPLFLLLPLAVRTRCGAHSKVWRASGIIALALLVAANGYSLAHYYLDDAYARDDYRGVARYVQRGTRPGERSVLLNGYLILFRYYGDETTIEGGDLPQDGFSEAVRTLTDNAPSVTLISDREWSFWRRDESIPEAMDRQYRLVSTTSFSYFAVYRFDLRR